MRGNLQYYSGEVKLVKAKVAPKNTKEIVVVGNAKYELVKTDSNRIIEKGNLDIEGDTVSTILGITEPGFYELKVIIKVGKEIFIEKAHIRVDK